VRSVLVALVLALGCGHHEDASTSAATATTRSSALEKVVAAQGRAPAVPAAPSVPYCPSSTTSVHVGCEATEAERAALLVETKRHLADVDAAFFRECRRRRDKLARMLTSPPSPATSDTAAELMVDFVAKMIAGEGAETSDAGGMPSFRGRLRESLLKALADALDDQVVQHEPASFEHLDTISDRDLKWIDGAADASRAGTLVDMTLLYIGKQTKDEP
jgi:hypothetical protein